MFGKRVSPHFSTAPELLIVLAQGRSICSTLRFHFSRLSPSGKMKRLLSLGVEVLICGGIDAATRKWLEKRGIRVIDNMVGEAMEVLPRLLNDIGRKEIQGAQGSGGN